MAGLTGRVGAIDGSGRGRVLRRRVPEPGAGMVLVSVRASLISPGTELNAARQARAAPAAGSRPPAPFGYQNAGVVLETGAGVSGIGRGDRVACMGAGYALHADYTVVPQNLCARLPDNVSFEEGAFAHLAMTSLHAIRRGRPEAGEYLLVAGLGLVGQLAARLGQLSGAYVMGWDLFPRRVETARRWGIDEALVTGGEEAAGRAADFTRGNGFDMAVLAFGGEATAALGAIAGVMKLSPDGHRMGRICMVGGATVTCRWGTGLGNLDLLSCARTGPGYHDPEWETGARGYPPVFVRWHTRAAMELVLRLISERKLDVACLVTHRLPVEEIDRAVSAHLESPGETLGTVLVYDSASTGPSPGQRSVRRLRRAKRRGKGRLMKGEGAG